RLFPFACAARRPRRGGFQGAEAPPVPATAVTARPEEWMLDHCTAPPVPAAPIPQLTPAVAAVVHEGLELGMGHRRRGNFEGSNFDGGCPLLVVEDEGLVGRTAEQERP